MDYQIQYFFPDAENIKLYTKLLKNQGVEVCQQKIDKDWITKSLHAMSYGIVYITEKAQIGRRSIKRDEDKYHVYGFVLCRIDSDNPEIAWIDLVCSKRKSKVGVILMELMEEYCRTKTNIKSIQLYSLPEEKLQQWYKKLGFIVTPVILLWDNNKPKAYLMQKFIQ
jgi:hypothetical protein